MLKNDFTSSKIHVISMIISLQWVNGFESCFYDYTENELDRVSAKFLRIYLERSLDVKVLVD